MRALQVSDFKTLRISENYISKWLYSHLQEINVTSQTYHPNLR